jgi:hypothetical protein
MLYSALVTEILPDVLGCPDFTIERAVRDACVEFCDTALVYTVDQDPVRIIANIAEVDLEIPTGTRLVQVLRAQIGRLPLERISRDDLFNSGRDWKKEKGRPQAITFESERSVRLVPIPSERLADPLHIRFAVAPTMASTSVPDSVGERYFRDLVYGAKSILLNMPGQPWTNPPLATLCRSLFERGMREAALTTSQDGVTGTKRVKMRRVV